MPDLIPDAFRQVVASFDPPGASDQLTDRSNSLHIWIAANGQYAVRVGHRPFESAVATAAQYGMECVVREDNSGLAVSSLR